MLFSPMSAEKLKLFTDLFQTALSDFRKHKDDVTAIAGEDKQLATPEGAALVVVANALLNLDEIVTKN